MSDDTTIDFWASNRNISSNALHAYKDGKAICGSPLEPSTPRFETPGCIGCKKCIKIWLKNKDEKKRKR